jgi:hypothetical protein
MIRNVIAHPSERTAMIAGRSRTLIFTLLATLVCLQPVGARSPQAHDEPVPVTIDNFIRAETDHYFKAKVERAGIGAWAHDREPTPIGQQTIIRMNRDTPYSQAVFDLTTPVTIVKPDTGERFQSILVINSVTARRSIRSATLSAPPAASAATASRMPST